MNKLLRLLPLLLIAAACTPGGAGDDSSFSATEFTSPVLSEPSDTEQPDTGSGESDSQPADSFAGTVDAPEFPDGLDWINTSQPITLDSLKGKVVLLDFWTYGCINCIHVIPDLQRLEEEFPNELVVIGVHSAKFSNEGDTAQIVEVVQRYGLEHPVVNDKDFTVWGAWGANAWPTVALVDPAGKVVGIRAGEGVYEAVQPFVAGLVAEFDTAGTLDRTPLSFDLETDGAPTRALRYPGKVHASDGRLWVADTGHNRILEVHPSSGEVLAAYGSGERGSTDGAALEASFNAPQGLFSHEGTLFVADTDNHLVRSIDLASGVVSTIAGTGSLGYPARTGPADLVALNSPWDILHHEGILYVANAGTHQLVSIELGRNLSQPLVGSGRESTVNGPFLDAGLAQPSSLTISGEGLLYFADSESSSIRAADLSNETTQLIVGGDENLFTFGDEDGAGNEARLQHPLGTALFGSTLFVADTYNSKIKRVDTSTNTVSSWLGSEPGWADGDDPRFNEPGGIAFMDGRLYVADTNNHAVRVIDSRTELTTTLILKGVERFDPPAVFQGDVITLEATSAHAGPASLSLAFELPAGYKVNDDAPSTVTVADGTDLAEFGGKTDTFDLTGTKLPVTVPLVLAEGSGTVLFDVTLIYCEETATSLCLIDRSRFELPIDVGPTGLSTQITLSKSIPEPN